MLKKILRQFIHKWNIRHNLTNTFTSFFNIMIQPDIKWCRWTICNPMRINITKRNKTPITPPANIQNIFIWLRKINLRSDQLKKTPDFDTQFIISSQHLLRSNKHISAILQRSISPIRSAIEHIDKIKCPLFLEHGTADETVPHEHTQKLEEKLRSQNKQVKVKYYEGGLHSLEPTITKIEAFKAMATDPMNNLTCDTDDDFMTGRTIKIPCGEKTLIINWSQPTDSINLFHWN